MVAGASAISAVSLEWTPGGVDKPSKIPRLIAGAGLKYFAGCQLWNLRKDVSLIIRDVRC